MDTYEVGVGDISSTSCARYLCRNSHGHKARIGTVCADLARHRTRPIGVELPICHREGTSGGHLRKGTASYLF